MWNLSGDDIKRAIEELRGRRTAIQTRYETEMKQLETDLAELENFERFAVRIVSDYLGDAAATGPAALAADPAPPAAEPSPAAEEIITVSERAAPPRPEPAAEPSAEAEQAVGAEPSGGAKSSRWRMRLGAGEASR